MLYISDSWCRCTSAEWRHFAEMKIVDDRVRLLQEVLQGIRVISECLYDIFEPPCY